MNLKETAYLAVRQRENGEFFDFTTLSRSKQGSESILQWNPNVKGEEKNPVVRIAVVDITER